MPRVARTVAWAVACILSFATGYNASSCRHADRVFEEGKRQMLEAMVNLIRSGGIEVNEDRLRDLSATTNLQHMLENPDTRQADRARSWR